MKRIILFFSVLFQPLVGVTQQQPSFAPMGAKWFYRPWEFTQPEDDLFIYEVTKDTILDSLPARELTCTYWVDGVLQLNTTYLNKYVHTDSGKVWYWVYDEWVLIFNFDAQVGDTIHSKVGYYGIPDGCAFPYPQDTTWQFSYRIDSLGTEMQNGVPLKVQYVSCADTQCYWYMHYFWKEKQAKIVERLGCIDAGFWWGSGSPCVLAGTPGYQRCYQDTDLNFKGPIGNTECDYLSTTGAEKTPLTLFPNPTTGEIRITSSFHPTAFRVLNSLGQVVTSGVFVEYDEVYLVLLSGQPSGMYLVEISVGTRTYVSHVVLH
ncbi:MAG: T9SS type A sorting domain-containing protein [Saprospiraceae bacterium]|nr:T9SS type A sorting domain-containing protein [Saprospiraceae bacterium]